MVEGLVWVGRKRIQVKGVEEEFEIVELNKVEDGGVVKVEG